MDNLGQQRPVRMIIPSAPRSIRVAVSFVELALVIALAYLLAQFIFQLTSADPVRNGALPPVDQQAIATIDLARLTTFDPFYRDLGAAGEVQQQTAIRESSLRLEVFGLRSSSNGAGSAIIKTPDGEQKLVNVGERVSAGVTLAAVYPDRLEINRAGVREAIYLRPQRERQGRTPTRAPSSTSSAPSTETPLDFAIEEFELSPVRRDRRIVGFQIPEPLPLALLGSGLEAGDILMQANGQALSSFERLQEMGEQLAGSQTLTLEIERRGERRSLTLSLGGSR